MQKKALIFLVIVFLAGSVSANEVRYEVDVNRQVVMMNATVLLDCEGERCPTLKWRLPDESEVLSVSDTSGRLKDYDVKNSVVIVRPGVDTRKQNETFEIWYKVDREAEEIYDGLYKRKLSLRSFEGSETSGKIMVEDLLSGWTGHGANSSFEENELNFATKGPLTFRVKFGEGYRTDYYEFFGGRPENSSKAFEVAAGTTGRSLPFKRLPVALLPNELFNRTVSKWSSGEYIGGSARMRQGLEDEFLPVLAHETVHALNNRELKWDETSSSYFEEGSSRHVEFLVRRQLYNKSIIDRPPRELFGESIRYDPDKSDSYYQELPSKGSADVLWGYYQNGDDFMKRWNPFDSPEEYRSFGYAYSELMIKNYLIKNNATLSDLYSDLDVKKQISDPEEKWEMFSQHLDMTPCKYESRERFEECLDRINRYDYSIYSASPEVGESGGLTVKKLEVPEREEKRKTEGLSPVDPELELREKEASSIVDKALDTINWFIERLSNFLESKL